LVSWRSPPCSKRWSTSARAWSGSRWLQRSPSQCKRSPSAWSGSSWDRPSRWRPRDNLQTAHLPHLQLSATGAGDDPESLAERLAARVRQLLDEREAEGELTVQAWLDCQPIPPMRELVLSMLRDRLKDTMAQLEQAILSGERERIAGLTHQFRGWSGTYQMHDLYALIERMDCAIARPEESLAEVRSCWLEIRRLLERIPARYLKPEERSGSPAFP